MTTATALKVPPPVLGKPSLRVITRNDDTRLALELRARRDGSLEDVYERFGRPTFGLLVQMLGDRGLAEDVQQEVFLEVWKRAHQYDPSRSGLLTWIMTIARSRAIDALRKRTPEPQDPDRAARLADREDEAGSADALIERWQVAHMLRRIPADEAELLRLRFYEDRSQREIAEAVGMPLGTVKMRMVSALRRLRALMDEEGGA